MLWLCPFWKWEHKDKLDRTNQLLAGNHNLRHLNKLSVSSKPKYPSYKLAAVIVHKFKLRKPHYVDFVKSGSNWIQHDNEMIQKNSIKSVLETCGISDGEEDQPLATMLIYTSLENSCEVLIPAHLTERYYKLFLHRKQERSTIICYQLTCYQLTCYQPHLISPHLLSIHLLFVSLALSLTCAQASLALATLALQPHLLSGQFAIRPHLLSKRLLSSLNCYQCSSAIQNQLLSKYVAIKIVVLTEHAGHIISDPWEWSFLILRIRLDPFCRTCR